MNLPMLESMSDEDLIKLCHFKKESHELSDKEQLIVELRKRLEASKNHVTGYDSLLADLENLKGGLIETKAKVVNLDTLATDIANKFNNNVN